VGLAAVQGRKLDAAQTPDTEPAEGSLCQWSSFLNYWNMVLLLKE